MVLTVDSAWPALSPAASTVLFKLLTGGPSSRVELAADLTMSKSSLTRLTRELADAGLVTEGETMSRFATGRPSEQMQVVGIARRFVGIKLTGDALYAAVADLLGRVDATRELPLTSHAPDDVVAEIRDVIADLRREHPSIVGVGVTLAGSVLDIDNRQVVLESEFLGWSDVDLGRMVEAEVGLPVAVQNDVQALTAAEHWFGLDEHLDSLAVITVGAGVGCGIVANGKLVVGATGTPGRVSHFPVDRLGPLCRSGHRGCVEVYLTNDAIARSVSAARGETVGYLEAVDLARAGDAAAQRVFDEAGMALGHLIAVVADLVDPARVIVTGDGIAVWELALPNIRAGVAAGYRGDIDALRIDSEPFEFDEWARAAAILALRSAVAGPTGSRLRHEAGLG